MMLRLFVVLVGLAAVYPRSSMIQGGIMADKKKERYPVWLAMRLLSVCQHRPLAHACFSGCLSKMSMSERGFGNRDVEYRLLRLVLVCVSLWLFLLLCCCWCPFL
ncbi:hypothetical protein V8F06_000994 [Rhypophila decipiens]